MNRPKSRSPRIEVLEGRLLLSVMVAETERNNRAGQADVFAFEADGAARLQGVSEGREDKDFFAFTAPSSGVMNVAVRSRNGVFAQLEIETPGGASLLETRPKQGLNSGTLAVTAGQTYLVRLRTPIKASASYTADLTLGGTPGSGGGGTTPDAVVGDSRTDDRIGRANAVTLRSGDLVQLQGTVSKKDRDFYAFTAPQSGLLSIDSSTTNGVLAKVEVQDAASLKLFETEPNDGVNSGAVALVAGQTYFVRVRSAINKASSTYRVDLRFSADTGGGGSGGSGGGSGGTPLGTTFAESEPNGDNSGATPFRLNASSPAVLTGTSTSKDDRDFFRWTPTQGGIVTVALASTGGPLAELEVETTESVNLLELEDGLTRGTFTATAGVAYLVRLRAPGVASASYRVDLTFA